MDQALKDAFYRDGYFVFDPEIPMETIDGAVAGMAAFFDDQRVRESSTVEGGTYAGDRRLQDGWKENQCIRDIANAPKVASVLTELYGRKPLPFQTLNFPVGTEQPIHSDTIHFNSKPSGFMCGVWVALEDIDMDNGPVIYYPGSHLLPEVDMAEVAANTPDEPAPLESLPQQLRKISRKIRGKQNPVSLPNGPVRYENYIRKLVAGLDIQPRYATLRKGQAFVWAANLLHGGSHQRDKSRTRRSQVTHFFFEGCRYYTPMFSRGNDILWRDPRWIG